jgi:hypothetical protein
VVQQPSSSCEGTWRGAGDVTTEPSSASSKDKLGSASMLILRPLYFADRLYRNINAILNHQ